MRLLQPRIFVALLLGFLLSAAAPPPPAHAADNPQKAKELYQQGTTFFDLGQFDKAIDAWQAGYRERPDAVFLYNIAQAYRLSGDAGKAIFFYKGYLRNAPKAHNRADVEQKLAALQLKLDQEHGTKPAPVATPARSDAPSSSSPPVAATPAPPPPVAATPRVTVAASTEPPPMAAPSVIVPSGPTTVSVEPPPPLSPEAVPRVDLGAAIGVDGWGTSVQGKADPSFAFTLSAGYIVARTQSRHPIQLRLGAAFGYTFLKEATGNDTFISGLIVPTLFVGLTPRLSFLGEFGIGALGIYGLKVGSPLLVRDPTIKSVDGAQGLFEIRPAIGLQYQLTRAIGVYGEGAIAYSPKGDHFYAAISRSELLFGVSFRTLPR